MKKYLYIYKTELMSNIQYTFNLLGSFIGYFIMVFILFNLWKYIYSNPNEVINGYTMQQTVWYVIITELLWGIMSGRKYCFKISQDVKSGNIAYNINKPYDYILYSLFNNLGSCTVRMILYTPLAITLGYLFLNMFPKINIVIILCVLLVSILSLTINTLLITFIGLFSFIIEDSTPFYWVYSKLILVLGTIFPIEYLPAFIRPIMRFTPIYVVSYGPARLFVNFNINDFIMILIAQIIYIFIGFTLCKIVYDKGVKRLNVNGG